MSDRKGYLDFVKAEGDLARGAFLAICSLFRELGKEIKLFCKTQITNNKERKSCGRK